MYCAEKTWSDGAARPGAAAAGPGRLSRSQWARRGAATGRALAVAGTGSRADDSDTDAAWRPLAGQEQQKAEGSLPGWSRRSHSVPRGSESGGGRLLARAAAVPLPNRDR